ncbi:MAG: SUMF1/EgtB/PvdO family nonheme iron enzyme [Saprospiraceae bacterium]|nr:SUMF1/EgtB/PvdO family nonheme iron enzyme [Saprospiraceae bacterium]
MPGLFEISYTKSTNCYGKFKFIVKYAEEKRAFIVGTYRVLRGGSWNNNAENCRVAYRNNNNPDNRNNNVGFRVVFVP